MFIQLFNFQENNIRVIEINNEPWFVGKDIATALGYKDTSDAIKVNVEEEDRNVIDFRDFNDPVNDLVVEFDSKNPKMIAINESGLYSLILKSRLEV